MACSPNQDQFVWPLEIKNISRFEPKNEIESSAPIKDGWVDEDYVEPIDEEQDEEEKEEKTTTPIPIEKVQVVTKIRYFLSERQAQDFLDSCW